MMQKSETGPKATFQANSLKPDVTLVFFIPYFFTDFKEYKHPLHSRWGWTR